jgi:hypothetical protein
MRAQGDMETWKHVDMETWIWKLGGMETWRHVNIENGNLETWRHGHGDINTWKHGKVETRKHGDMDIATLTGVTDMETRAWRHRKEAQEWKHGRGNTVMEAQT